ncbi:MAG: hypothetical protein Q7S40_19625 [Opitutaceae bacterium]|nr:hypothetical protein [Opitutaceae bacterium]
MGVPLPASTQRELLEPLSELAQPIFEALVVQAANAPLLHHNDTTMRILDLWLRRQPRCPNIRAEPAKKIR